MRAVDSGDVHPAGTGDESICNVVHEGAWAVVRGPSGLGPTLRAAIMGTTISSRPRKNRQRVARHMLHCSLPWRHKRHPIVPIPAEGWTPTRSQQTTMLARAFRLAS